MFLTGDSTFASLALATILVVAVAVLGSLTVLPALLSRLGDKVDRGRVPFVGRLRRDDGEGRFWGAIVDRVLRRPGALGGARRRLPAGARRAGAAAAPGGSGPRVVPEGARGHRDVRPDAAGISGLGPAGERRRRGTERARADGAAGDRRARATGARERPCVRADHRGRQQRGHGREHHRPDRRERDRRRLERVLPHAARTRSSPRRSAPFRTRRPASPGRPPSGGTRRTH